MLVAFAVIHVIVCLSLIGLVLLQDPKSGGTGGVFGGGGSSSFLGATGSVTFLTKLTRYCAIIFGVTCLILTLLSRPDTQSVIDVTPANAAAPVNATESSPENASNPATTNTEGTETSAPAGEQAAPAQPTEAPKQ